MILDSLFHTRTNSIRHGHTSTAYHVICGWAVSLAGLSILFWSTSVDRTPIAVRHRSKLVVAG